MSEPSLFATRGTAHEIEEGRIFAPKLDVNGLIVCVVSDATSGEVLMVAYMNEAAIAKTIETGEAWFFSRSRQALWRKGESSGHTLRVIEFLVDCDQDALLLRVEQASPGACHTGRASCFYRVVPLKQAADRSTTLEPGNVARLFDPAAIYGGKGKL